MTNNKQLHSIGEHLRTQDNRCTSNPVFYVEALERIGPMDTDYNDNRMYHNHEECQTYYPDRPDPEEWKRLNDLDGECELPSHISAGGYVERWKVIQACFTENGCKRYLEQDGHNLRHYFGVRIYAGSFNRNDEMLEIRQALMDLQPTES